MKNKLIILLVFFSTILITSCSRAEKTEPIILSINYPSYDIFYEKIGYPFEQKYPNIKIQVIEEKIEPSKNLVTDIIYMNSLEQYKEIAAQHQLLSLSTLMLNDKKTFQSVSKIVTTAMTLNDGEIYGLAPTFYNSGLQFNIDLFHRYNVPLPQNQITWTELYELANQFPRESVDGSRIYGFSSNHLNKVPIKLIIEMGKTEGLSFINPETNQITINTPEWIAIGEIVLNAIKNQSVFVEAVDEPMVGGENAQVAMKIVSSTDIMNYELYVKPYINQKPNLGLVTVPVNPLAPDYSDSYRFNEIYGINVHIEKRDAAWTFINYLMSDPGYYNFYLNVFWEHGV